MTKSVATTSNSNKTHRFANGDRMPLIGLGTWKSDPGEVYAAVREAIRIGYRHLDCASLYGNEAEIGHAIRDAIREGDVTRKDLWITSKLWCNAHGRGNVEPALRKTLADLGLEYLDLYLVHWPIPLKPSAFLPGSADDFMPPAEVPIHSTWAGMEAVVGAGLVRHLGISNFSVKKIPRAPAALQDQAGGQSGGAASAAATDRAGGVLQIGRRPCDGLCAAWLGRIARRSSKRRMRPCCSRIQRFARSPKRTIEPLPKC